MKHIFSSLFLGIPERKVPTKSEPRSFFSSVSFSSSASFTLVELLIVIGILAILTSAIVLILNPAELLRQSRDGKRIQDMASINSAISILLTQNPSISLGVASTVYVSIPDASSVCANLSLPTLYNGYVYNCVSTSTLTNIDGTGWLPINFASSSIGSFSLLPTDPSNVTSSGFYYVYIPTANSLYEVASKLESTKRKQDIANDGGDDLSRYEVGTSVNLIKSSLGVDLIESYGIDWKNPSAWTFSTTGRSFSWDDSTQALKSYGYNNVYITKKIPIDTSKKYYLQYDVMTRNISPGKILYSGTHSYATINGGWLPGHPGSYDYFCDSGGSFSEGVWSSRRNNAIGGVARTGESSVTSDVNKWETGTKYATIMFLFNYGSDSPQETYIRNLKFYEVK